MLCCASLAAGDGLAGRGISYGLSFNSYEVTQDERTALDLTPNSRCSAASGFAVEFDFQIKYGSSFGYIFRFIDDRQNHLDFCSSHDASKYSFIFGDADEVHSNITVDMDDGCGPHHLRVKVTDGRIICCLDGRDLLIDTGKGRLGDFKLLFGCVDDDRYFTTDIPHFTIKNVCLLNGKGKMLRSWPMSRHAENAVYDTLYGRKAVVKNGIWEIDNHIKWVRREVYYIPSDNSAVTSSDDGQNIFIVYDDQLIVYFTRDGHTERRTAVQGSSPAAMNNLLVYDREENILVTATPLQEGVSIYALATNEWKSRGHGSIPYVFTHPGIYLDDATKTLYLAGGYGMHRYFGTIHSIKVAGDNCWDTLETGMSPRYMCGVAPLQDSIIVIGGFGSQSGLQEEDPRNLYDILRINRFDGKCDTVALLKRSLDAPFVFAGSTVEGEGGRLAYTLIYDNERFNSQVRMAAVDLSTGDMELFAEPLPLKFHDISSYCKLFKGDYGRASLYAVLTQPQGGSGSEVSIYSMAYPPLHESDVIIHPRNINWIALLVASLVAVIIFLLVIIQQSKPSAEAEPFDISVQTVKVDKSFIRLLGGFQVIDKSGKNITGEFSPILKTLLSFIVLRAGKDGKGVSNQLIDSAFWDGYDRKNAINNRRVNLSKLRALLLKVGPVALDSSEGYVNLRWGSGVYCDWYSLLAAIKKHDIDEIISVGSLGPLLPDLDHDCLTEFKSDLTWRLSDFLASYHKSRGREDLRRQLQLADVVLMNDSIDETAIVVKCKALYLLGQKGLSKTAYDKFVSQYKEILSDTPDITYPDLLK